MSKEQEKTAQQADVEGVIEKEIPVEPATKTVEDIGFLAKAPGAPEADPSELVDVVQGVLDKAWDLGIPPQLSLPLATTLDQFRVDKSDFDALHSKFKAVLDHLREAGKPDEKAEQTLEKFKKVKDIPIKTVIQLLNLANTMDKLGIYEAADNIGAFLKTAAIDKELEGLLKREEELRVTLEDMYEEEPENRDLAEIERIKAELDDVQDQILSRRSKFELGQRGQKRLVQLQLEEQQIRRDLDKAIADENRTMTQSLYDALEANQLAMEQITKDYGINLPKEKLIPSEVMERAEQLINPQQLPILEQFRLALMSDQFEKAEELFKTMTPDERKQSVEISRQYHKAAYLAKLHSVGKKLFEKGKYTEASTINNIVKAQLIDLEPEMQEQVILILIPDDMNGDLPQGFQNQKRRDPEEILRRMTDMTQRLNVEPEPEPKSPCPCGGGCGCGAMPPALVSQLVDVANQLDTKGLTAEADMIDTWLKVAAEGEEPLFTPEEVEEAVERISPTTQKLIKRFKERDIAITPCPLCKQEIFYDKKKGRPPFCPSCGKGPWGAGSIRGSLNTEAATKTAAEEHGGKPAKVVEIADAIRRDNPGISDEVAYRMAWETFCSYTNPSYEGCTSKGKSERESPKSERA